MCSSACSWARVNFAVLVDGRDDRRQGRTRPVSAVGETGWSHGANNVRRLIVMSLLCSGAITLLFRLRDRGAGLAKGVVKW